MSLKDEFAFRTSRSGGKGGQHTNKRETKVTLVFDIEASHHLSNAQKSRVKNNLSHRINKRGKLLITSQESRSQWGNKKIVKKRFYKLLFQALQPQPTRKPISPRPLPKDVSDAGKNVIPKKSNAGEKIIAH